MMTDKKEERKIGQKQKKTDEGKVLGIRRPANRWLLVIFIYNITKWFKF